MRPALDPRLTLVAALALGWSGIALAQAQERAVPAPQVVSVRVMVVHASQEKGTIDPECRDLPRQLGPLKFGALRLIQQRRLRLDMGQRGSVALPGGREVRMLPVSIVKRRLFMNLEVPGQVNGQFSLRPGRPLVLGGQRHQGGHLIVYIEPDF